MNWQAEVRSEIRVAGSDPEMADMDNPRGLIYKEVFFVILTAADGERLAGPIVKGPDSKLPAAIQRSLDRGYDPTTSLAFQPIEPAYGSLAYQRDGIELERLYCERKEEGVSIYG